MNTVEDIGALRREVTAITERLEGLIRDLAALQDFSDAAVTARVDLQHVVRDLRRGDMFLGRAQRITQPDRWEQDVEAGAIG